MTSRDIALFKAWYMRHPFGQEHTDYLIAQNTAVLSNRWRGKAEAARKPTEFLPLYQEPQQTPEEMMAVLRGALGRK